MNTKMMEKSFMDCVASQSCWPKAFVVEHGNKAYCNLDMDFQDNAQCEIKKHGIEDLDKVKAMPIAGFTFGENCRPIVYDESLEGDLNENS